jgi:ribosome biogenesis protein Nip4
MTILFRDLTTDEKQLLKDSLSFWLNENQAVNFYEKNHFLIAEGRWREIFIITKEIQEFIHQNKEISPYSVGLGFGEFRNQIVYLSLSGASFIANLTNKKAIISSEGEQPFLFQKHILVKSIISCSHSCKINEKLIVTNQKGDFLGIGQLKVAVNKLKDEKIADHMAIYNLMDLGWYLRKGK